MQMEPFRILPSDTALQQGGTSTILIRMNFHVRPSLRGINHVLFICIIVIDAYIILIPFLPGVTSRPAAAQSTKAAPYVRQLQAPHTTATANQPNQLIIPGMQLDQQIYEGTDTYAELAKGVWHWPGSSSPDKGSNTVLLGHRFTYTNPRGVFYFLNTVKVGDEIGIIWNNATYTYVVDTIKVVPPTQTDILAPADKPTLTIYTCTPTWWPKDRLVIVSHLEKTS